MPINPIIAQGIQPIDFSNSLLQVASLKQRDQALANDKTRQDAIIRQQQQVQAQLAQKEKLMQALAKVQWAKQNGRAAVLSDPSIDPQAAQALSSMTDEQFMQHMSQQEAQLATLLGKGPKDTSGDPEYGKVNPGDFTPESLAAYDKTKKFGDLVHYVTPANDKVVLVNGVPTMVDPRSHETTPLSTQQATMDANTQRAQSTATGTALGQAQGQAQAALPTTLGAVEDMRTSVKALRDDPALRYIVGGYSMTPGGAIPGTSQAGALAKWEQIQGQAFLQAFNTLKGGGQITEVEGAKATAAISRLVNRKQSLEDYKKSVDDFLQTMDAIERRLRLKAQRQGASGPVPAGTTSPQNDDPLGIR